EKPVTAPIAHFALDRLAAREHSAEILKQPPMLEVACEVFDRSSDVMGQKIERLGELRGKPPDPELAIEEDGSDLGAGEQIVHVVRQLGELSDLLLVFGVDRVELLIDALELFVGAL